MANNLVVQLLLKTGTFSTDLKQAGGQVKQFKQNCSTAGKALTDFGREIGINIGSLTKLGGAAGAAIVAFKTFKDVMYSTQTTADALDGAIAGCKGVIEALKVSVATADFSTFSNGLWAVFDAAKAARDALDDLQDAQLAYGYKTSKNRRLAREAEVGYKTPGITAAEKEEYRKVWEQAVINQELYSNAFDYKLLNAIRSQVVAKNTNIQGKNVTQGLLERAMDIQLGLEGDTSEVKRKVKERADFIKKEAKKYATDSAREQYYSRNQEDLILDVLLQMKDETIKAVVTEGQAGEQAREEAASMRKAYNRAIKGTVTPTVKGGGSSTVTKEDLTIMEKSRTYWDDIAKKSFQVMNASETNTQAWKDANAQYEEAIGKIKEIDEATKAYNTRQNFTPLEKLPEIKSGYVPGLKPEEIRYTATELQNLINMLTNLRDEMQEGDPYIAIYNQRIQELGEKLDKIRNEGINKVEVPKQTVDSWDTFSQAMANTATVVSTLTNTFKEGTEVTASSILQMVATSLPAIGQLIGSIEALTAVEAVEAGVAATGKAVSTSKHWIEAIAAVASLGAVVASAIAAADAQRQKFAGGGIVGGSSFTGDRVPAMVNSGEMILNRAQQANLFRMANSGGTGGQVEFHISGTELIGVLNNQNRKNSIIR